MAKPLEHAEGPAVVRVSEMVGISAKGWEDAAQQIVARASQTIRHITGLDLVRASGVVRDGRIVEYHVTARVAFVVESADAGPASAVEAEEEQIALFHVFPFVSSTLLEDLS